MQNAHKVKKIQNKIKEKLKTAAPFPEGCSTRQSYASRFMQNVFSKKRKCVDYTMHLFLGLFLGQLLL